MNTPSHKAFLRACKQSGATLVEQGVVLAAMGLLVVGTFGAMNVVQQSRKQDDVAAYLSAARMAIHAFVLRENRLPCPALNDSGREGDGSGSACPPGIAVGQLPYVALNLEKPVLPEGVQFVRYGVWRDPGSDLVAPAPISPSSAFPLSTVAIDADGSGRFARNLLDAARNTAAGTSQPYIADKDGSGRFTNCSTVRSNPGVVLTAAVGDGNCFTDGAGKGVQMEAISKYELLGWFRDGIR